MCIEWWEEKTNSRNLSQPHSDYMNILNLITHGGFLKLFLHNFHLHGGVNNIYHTNICVIGAFIPSRESYTVYV